MLGPEMKNIKLKLYKIFKNPIQNESKGHRNVHR